jgi:hypothetical protein
MRRLLAGLVLVASMGLTTMAAASTTTAPAPVAPAPSVSTAVPVVYVASGGTVTSPGETAHVQPNSSLAVGGQLGCAKSTCAIGAGSQWTIKLGSGLTFISGIGGTATQVAANGSSVTCTIALVTEATCAEAKTLLVSQGGGTGGPFLPARVGAVGTRYVSITSGATSTYLTVDAVAPSTGSSTGVAGWLVAVLSIVLLCVGLMIGLVLGRRLRTAPR